MSGTPATIERPAPMAGEHTVEILREFGFDSETIERFHASGSIAGLDPAKAAAKV